jgi:hypothetical protein
VKRTFRAYCKGHKHRVELREDGDDIVVDFPDHDDIEKDETVAAMQGTTTNGDCFDVYAEITGGTGTGLSHLLDRPSRLGENDKVRLLLDAGADPNIQDDYGDTPLYRAAYSNQAKTARILLDAGANPDLWDNFNNTPLLQAASRGHFYVVRVLLEAGADPSIADRYGKTPLHWAAGNSTRRERLHTRIEAFSTGISEDHVEIFRLLLKAGADPGAKDNDGLTALDEAHRAGGNKRVELFERIISGKPSALREALEEWADEAVEEHEE